MKKVTKLLLVEAWNWCDENDKSTEFMLQYMADTAGVDYDVAVDFVTYATTEERQQLSKEILIIAHAEWVKELNASGYAGILSTGEIVDRREHPKAIPVQENELFGVVKPKKLKDER